jgi:hypothetical protein
MNIVPKEREAWDVMDAMESPILKLLTYYNFYEILMQLTTTLQN